MFRLRSVSSRFSLCVLSVAGAGALALCFAWAANAPADRAKGAIESRPERVVAALSTTATADANPAVKPGKVNWHPTFAEACAASKQSGKPVLLFQLLGKLDHKFC